MTFPDHYINIPCLYEGITISKSIKSIGILKFWKHFRVTQGTTPTSLNMQTRSMSKQKVIKSSVESHYNLRPRQQVYIDDQSQSNQHQARQELLEELEYTSKGKMVKLDNDMIQQLRKHQYKKNLRVCSLPIPNCDDLEMKSSENENIFKPKYVVCMIWENKDIILIEDAKLFINEIFDCSSKLFRVLDEKVQSLPYFKDYFDYVTVNSKQYIENVCFGHILCFTVYHLGVLIRDYSQNVFCFFCFFCNYSIFNNRLLGVLVLYLQKI